MPTVEEAIKRLHYSDGQHVAIVIWCEDDVLERAKELDIECSREQAQSILNQIDHRQSCEQGITWDTIDYYLYEIKEGRL